jgi:hypothetical protein
MNDEVIVSTVDDALQAGSFSPVAAASSWLFSSRLRVQATLKPKAWSM